MCFIHVSSSSECWEPVPIAAGPGSTTNQEPVTSGVRGRVFTTNICHVWTTERYFLKWLNGLENKAAKLDAENQTSGLTLVSFILRHCAFLLAIVKVLPGLARYGTISVSSWNTAIFCLFVWIYLEYTQHLDKSQRLQRKIKLFLYVLTSSLALLI